jgi:hypothetical protein
LLKSQIHYLITVLVDEPRQPTTWSERYIGTKQLLSIPSFLRFSLHSSPKVPPHNYQLGYNQFKHEHCKATGRRLSYDGTDGCSIDENLPDGWPRVAAFLEGCHSFGIYRRFGQCHSRLLVTHMSNITEIESQLRKLDKSDADGGGATQFRLKNRRREEGFDNTKIDLLEKLRAELIAYGTSSWEDRDISASNLNSHSMLVR